MLVVQGHGRSAKGGGNVKLSDGLPLPGRECPNCNGSGVESLGTDPWEHIKCNWCHGTGRLSEKSYAVGCRECPECEGKGEVYTELVSVPPYPTLCKWYPCPTCGGEGVISDNLYERHEDDSQ